MASVRTRPALVLLTAPAVVLVVLAGVWVTGAVITNEYRLAVWLTTAWMVVAAAGCVAGAIRSPPLRWPALGACVCAAVVPGVYLGRSELFDTVVHERVVTAPATTDAAERGNVRVAAGRFE